MRLGDASPNPNTLPDGILCIPRPNKPQNIDDALHLRRIVPAGSTALDFTVVPGGADVRKIDHSHRRFGESSELDNGRLVILSSTGAAGRLLSSGDHGKRPSRRSL